MEAGVCRLVPALAGPATAAVEASAGPALGISEASTPLLPRHSAPAPALMFCSEGLQ